MTLKEKQILSAIAAVAILAGGLVWAAKYYLTPVPQSQFPPEAQPIVAGYDQTANWKTYSNDKYGFEVKYPAIFSVKTESNSVMFDGPKDCAKDAPDIGYCFEDSLSIKVLENTNNISVDDWIKQNYAWGKDSNKNINIAGQTAIYLYPQETEFFSYKYIFTNPASKQVFDVTVSTGLDVNLAKQMLSTFKFTK